MNVGDEIIIDAEALKDQEFRALAICMVGELLVLSIENPESTIVGTTYTVSASAKPYTHKNVAHTKWGR